jgi:hypothetical protein
MHLGIPGSCLHYVLMACNWICCLLQNLASIVPGLEPAGVDLLSVRTSHMTFDTSNFYVSGWEPAGSIRALNMFWKVLGDDKVDKKSGLRAKVML